MRLFAAVPVPDPARAQVAGLLEQLRALQWPVRWVHDEGIHITLKFFGEVATERLDAIEEVVRSAAERIAPLSLRLGELGAFPGPSRPRVLWLGVEAPSALEVLQDRLERRSEAIGFPPEGRPFRPHVTLGRVREGQRLAPSALERCGARYEQVPFPADRVVLYESVLTRRGPEYTPRLTVSLES